MTRFEKVFDLPLARPEPDAPVDTLWVLLTAFLHGEPAPRAGNPGFARGSRPVAEVYTAARTVEWLIRIREIAAMVAFVAGPQSSFRTGFTIDLSGVRATY